MPVCLVVVTPPAQDQAGVHVDDERDVTEPGQGPHIGEVGHPQLIGAGRGMPAALDQIRMPRRGLVPPSRHGAVLPADRASDSGQPRRRATWSRPM